MADPRLEKAVFHSAVVANGRVWVFLARPRPAHLVIHKLGVAPGDRRQRLEVAYDGLGRCPLALELTTKKLVELVPECVKPEESINLAVLGVSPHGGAIIRFGFDKPHRTTRKPKPAVP